MSRKHKECLTNQFTGLFLQPSDQSKSWSTRRRDNLHAERNENKKCSVKNEARLQEGEVVEVEEDDVADNEDDDDSMSECQRGRRETAFFATTTLSPTTIAPAMLRF